MPLTRLSLLLRTLPYLKGRQMAYQLRYRLQTKLAADRHAAIRLPDRINARPLTPRTPFLQRPFIRRDDIERRQFSFLNQPAVFDKAIDWLSPGKSRLWRYNLHYFDYLFPDRPLDRRHGRHLLDDWIRSNPEGTPDAWDPFPISLRMVNWIKYLSTCRFDEDIQEVNASLYRQALWLERHLEFHLLANHLFKNIKAFIFAGMYFRGDDADRWYKRGVHMLNRELSEQILPDGGHFERSPMYHAMILEDVLDLINIWPDDIAGLQTLQPTLTRTAEKMAIYLQAMTHPDSGIALFNDAVFGVEHNELTLRSYYSATTGRTTPAESQNRLTAFPKTGYFIMTPAGGDKLIVDCGAIGPDYQSGHAHCDTLSFELSLGQRKVIVDSGCCQYEDSPIRQYNRGNAGHNTVTIDGQNQSEVWGAHRCARRAQAYLGIFREKADGTLLFKGHHDGYQRLAGHPEHQRTIRWGKGAIIITDLIEGAGCHTLVSTLHIHPDLEVTAQEDTVLVYGSDGPLVRIASWDHTSIEVQKGWYCPAFNRQLTCPKLTLSVATSLPAKMEWQIRMLS